MPLSLYLHGPNPASLLPKRPLRSKSTEQLVVCSADTDRWELMADAPKGVTILANLFLEAGQTALE